MAFIKILGNTVSFADHDDMLAADQRLFETNEGLTDTIIEDLLTKATGRILTRLRASEWWVSYYINRSSSTLTSLADVPALNPNKVVGRQSDFTDLCIATAMSEYILPKIADFGSQDNAEMNKMAYYAARADKLFGELITAGDWYDFDGNTTVESNEKKPGIYNLKRVR